MRTETCILTYSGRVINLLSPDPADISLYDIAEGLAKLCRYNGHVQSFYSQAQHSCLVYDQLAVDAKPYGLLYEAHQAYFGHLIKPVKASLAARNHFEIWEELAEPMKAAIHMAVGLKYPPHPKDIQLVQEKKQMIGASEKRDLLPHYKMSEAERKQALARMIHPWSWFKAQEIFLEKCRDIGTSQPGFLKNL